MGRMTENDAKNLNSVKKRDRAAILKVYLKTSLNQKEIAAKVFNNYDDWASMSISVVTRSFGFHEGRGKGRYRNIPDYVIDQFVRDYDPVDYYGGLDEGTFDRYIKDYQQQIEEENRRAEQQRQRDAQRAEEEKKRQAEYERQQAEWRAQQERERLRREEERRKREEAERLEKLRREREAAQKEAERKAAADRGDHITLMNEAFAAVKAEDFKLARAKAEKGWEIQPTVGLQAVFAYCFEAEGDRYNAAQWSWDAKKGYTEGCDGYMDMLVLHINNCGINSFSAAKELHKYGKLGRINDTGLKDLVKRYFDSIYYVSGGTKIEKDTAKADTKTVMEFLATLVAYREYPVNRKNRDTLLKASFILTQEGYYSMARDIYQSIENTIDCRKMDEAYDLKVNLGKCLYELEDYDGAMEAWFPDHGPTLGLVTQPLEAAMYYGYDEDILALTENHPDVQREFAAADDYRNGRITGSRYFSRFYGNSWQDVLDLSEDTDVIWEPDEFDEWHLVSFTPRPRGFLSRLFGR